MQSKFTSFLRTALLGCFVLATHNTFGQGYCMPTYGTPCNIGGDYVQSFSTTGGSTNISNLMSGCNGNANNYAFYSTQTLTTAAGSTIGFSVTNCPISNEYYKMWIDFNGNSAFDAAEAMWSPATVVAAGAVVSGTFTVPSGTASGTYRLRLRCQYIGPVDPCANTFYGETEDYNVVIQAATLCSGMPTAGTAFGSTTVCPGMPVSLSINGGVAGPGITYQWQDSGSAVSWTNISGANASTYSFNAAATVRYYRAAVTCSASSMTSYTNTAVIGISSNCTDSVWAGDANDDNVVNNSDILFLGLNMSLSGPSRPGASLTWAAQYCVPWSGSFLNVNRKHSDCNGDGTVTFADTTAVSVNYGLTHPKDGEENAAKVNGLPDLWIDLPAGSLVPGSTVTAPIMFGDGASPVSKVYGLAGTLKMSGVALSAAPAISFTGSWLAPAASLMPFSKTINTSSVAWALSRTTHTNSSGFGTLGTITFTVPMTGLGKLFATMQNVTMVDSSGTVITAYNLVSDSASVVQPAGIASVSSGGMQLSVVPNPGSAGFLIIDADKATAFRVVLTDLTGKSLWSESGNVQGSAQVTLPAELPSGLYLLRVSDGVSPVATLRWTKL